MPPTVEAEEEGLVGRRQSTPKLRVKEGEEEPASGNRNTNFLLKTIFSLQDIQKMNPLITSGEAGLGLAS